MVYWPLSRSGLCYEQVFKPVAQTFACVKGAGLVVHTAWRGCAASQYQLFTLYGCANGSGAAAFPNLMIGFPYKNLCYHNFYAKGGSR